MPKLDSVPALGWQRKWSRNRAGIWILYFWHIPCLMFIYSPSVLCVPMANAMDNIERVVCRWSRSMAMKKTLIFALCMGVASFVGCGEEGWHCEHDYECTSGVCDTYLRKCAGDVRNNELNCDIDSQCKSGLCYKGYCRATNKHDGESCYTNLQCKSGICYYDRCYPSNLETGEECRIDKQCRSSICQKSSCIILRLGQKCSKHVQCKSGYCDPYAEVCVEKSVGQSCRRDSECPSGLCINGNCTLTSN